MVVSNHTESFSEWRVWENYYNFDTAQGQLIFAITVCLVLVAVVLCRPRL